MFLVSERSQGGRAFVLVGHLVPCRRDAVDVRRRHRAPVIRRRPVEREPVHDDVALLLERIGDLRPFSVVEPEDSFSTLLPGIAPPVDSSLFCPDIGENIAERTDVIDTPQREEQLDEASIGERRLGRADRHARVGATGMET
jgi:hypothetical protein